ncbi:hypothetical protein ANO11243_049240 [Dothideomycetidae sp. 11243]|nr:hypothetical protein ANO11243_049240 [fungal sp. No.11243]
MGWDAVGCGGLRWRRRAVTIDGVHAVPVYSSRRSHRDWRISTSYPSYPEGGGVCLTGRTTWTRTSSCHLVLTSQPGHPSDQASVFTTTGMAGSTTRLGLASPLRRGRWIEVGKTGKTRRKRAKAVLFIELPPFRVPIVD